MSNPLKVGCDEHQGEFVAGNLRFRPVWGTTNLHSHPVDHVTLCVREPVHVYTESPSGDIVSVDLKVGELMHIPAYYLHRITTTDGRAICMYANLDDLGGVVHEFTGWLDVYAVIGP